MKTIYNIYEGVLADVEDTLSKYDKSIDVMAELIDARKLKFEPDKKDTCSVKFDCPNLLKCLDKRIITKLIKKSFSAPTTFMLCYGYDSVRNMYNISIHIFDERGNRCLIANSSWDYSNKAKSADIANELLEYILKSEKHFKIIDMLFDSNFLSYDRGRNCFEAPYFSPKTILFNLKRM